MCNLWQRMPFKHSEQLASEEIYNSSHAPFLSNRYLSACACLLRMLMTKHVCRCWTRPCCGLGALTGR